MIQPDLNKLLSDPDYLLFDLRKGPSFLFAGVSRATYKDSAFLDHRIDPRPERFYSVDVSKINTALEEAPLPPSLYIGHTSFCCSTLLARCLQSKQLLSLREPRVLGVIANEYRRGLSAVDVDPMTAMVFRLLAKTYQRDQQVFIKGTNFTNNLMPALLRLWPQTKLLLMWSDLESFLVSVCKHRTEAEKNLWPFLRAFLIDEGIPSYRHTEWESLDLMQQAVWTWTLQVRLFNRLLMGQNEFSPHDIKTLNAAQFLADPLAYVQLICQSLSVELDEASTAARVNRVMSRDAKKVTTEDSANLATQRGAIRAEFTEEIERGLSWAQEQDLQVDLSLLTEHHLQLP